MLIADFGESKETAPRMLMKTETKGRWLFSIFYLITMLGMFVILQLVLVRNPTADVSYNDFANEIRAGHIAEVQVGEIKYIGKFKTGVRKANEPQSISTGRLPGIEERPLIEEMEKQNVRIYGRVQTPGWWTLLL